MAEMHVKHLKEQCGLVKDGQGEENLCNMKISCNFGRNLANLI